MSKINGIIPPQSYELVRDRIGEILTIELANQYLLTSDEALNASVFVERFIPFDKTDLPAISVSYSRGDMDNQDVKHADHSATYFIDCFQSAKSSTSEQGDALSKVKLHRLIGVCRAIIQNPIYNTLDFDAPFIMFRQITSLEIADAGKQDAVSVTMGRLTLNVRIPENTQLIDAIEAGGYDTQVKLYETDKGYKYIIDN